MSIKKTFIILSIAIMSSLYLTSANDPVIEMIEKGMDAYQRDNYELAHDYLQDAINEINEKIGTAYVSFLPETPEGWSSEEVKDESASFSTSTGNVRVTTVEKRYIRNSDNEDIEVMISDSPEFIQPVGQLIEILQRENMTSNMVDLIMEKRGLIDKKKRGEWYILTEKISPNDFRILALHNKVIIEVDDSRSRQTAQKFIDLIDLKGIEAAME